MSRARPPREDPREVWDRVNAHQRDRWREHVSDALPERLLESLAPKAPEEPAD